MLQGVPFPFIRHCRTGPQQSTPEVRGAKSHRHQEVPGLQNRLGCDTWHCSAQLQLLKNRSLFKTMNLTMTTAFLPTRLQSRPSRRQTRLKGAQVLLLARPQLSETLRRFIATVTCRGTLQLSTGTASSGGCSEWGLQKLLSPLSPTSPLLLLPLLALKHLSLCSSKQTMLSITN